MKNISDEFAADREQIPQSKLGYSAPQLKIHGKLEHVTLATTSGIPDETPGPTLPPIEE